MLVLQDAELIANILPPLKKLAKGKGCKDLGNKSRLNRKRELILYSSSFASNIFSCVDKHSLSAGAE